MTEQLQFLLIEEGYLFLKEFEGIGICGVRRMLYTTGLVIGLSEDYYHGRYCYGTMHEAVTALNSWNGKGDPPGEWIAYKGTDGERYRVQESFETESS